MEHTCNCGSKWRHGGIGCGLWLAGWLFTLGYLQLPLLKAVFALIIWPYYLGTDWSWYTE